MTPIALFPSDASLKKSVCMGVFLLFIGYQYLTWSPNGEPIIPAMFALGGMYVFAQTALSYVRPRPSFAADANGFSVMGKKKRGWDEYRGVGIHTFRIAFFPVLRWVIVKTGKNNLGRKVHIKWLHLSGSAHDMAAEIDGYARIAKLVTQEQGAGVAAPQVDARPRPVVASPKDPERPFVIGAQTSGAGPVQSVPSFGERLFGRRKVM